MLLRTFFCFLFSIFLTACSGYAVITEGEITVPEIKFETNFRHYTSSPVCIPSGDYSGNVTWSTWTCTRTFTLRGRECTEYWTEQQVFVQGGMGQKSWSSPTRRNGGYRCR